MNTDKKKTSSFPAGKFTEDDIKNLREYVDALDALNEEEPLETLTPEEWNEAMKEISRTGKIPAKYAGRIAENEVTVYSDMVDGVYRKFPEGIKKKAYYDIAEAAHDERLASLNRKYHNAIVKAIINSPGEMDEETALSVTDIIRELLKNPVVLRELEKELKAGQFTELAPLGSVPNGEIVYWFIRTLNSSKGGRMVQASTRNRHEEITTLQKGDSLRFIRENKQTKTTQIIEMKNAVFPHHPRQPPSVVIVKNARKHVRLIARYLVVFLLGRAGINYSSISAFGNNGFHPGDIRVFDRYCLFTFFLLAFASAVTAWVTEQARHYRKRNVEIALAQTTVAFFYASARTKHCV